MKYFDYSKFKNRTWDKETVNYIGHIHEFKGRQQLYLTQRPGKLKTLIEVAKRQSTEASNEIEGIKTTSNRLIKLMNDKTTPKNRNEEEIIGYRYALNLIHESYEYISITPNYILQLHKEMCQFMDVDYGGKYKNSNNVIEDGNKKIIFKPLNPHEVSFAMDSLCEQYNKAINDYGIDPLLVIPVFIHDFLCIHPFKDGNGRLSRLLTTLLLYKNGFAVGRYISLEKKIQISKDNYYDSLGKSSKMWREGKNDETPFIKYTLSTILAAYRDFEERVNLVSKKISAKELVRNGIKKKMGKFSKADIVELCPEIKSRTIEKALKELCEEKVIAIEKKGRSTYYIRKK